MSNDTPGHPFEGFSIPNGTQVPDIVFDDLLARLSGAELKVLMYIIRRTLGFRRDGDNISLSQMLTGIRKRDGTVLDRGTGLSKKTLLTAINSLEEQGYILTQRRRSPEKGDEPTTYRLHLKSHPLVPPANEETTPPVGEKLHQGGGEETTPGPWRKNSPTQQTALQATDEQQVRTYPHSPFVLQDSSPSNFESAPAQKMRIRDETTDRTEVPTEPSAEPRRGFEKLRSVVERLPYVRDTQPGPPSASKAAVTAAEIRQAPRRRPPAETDLRLAIRPYLEQYAEELGDDVHLSSTVTRAVHLYEESGLTIDGFIRQLQQAHRETQRRSRGIRKRRASGGPGPAKNKIPYFFAILMDYLGLKEPTSEPLVMPASTELRPASAAPQQRPRRTVGGPLVPVIRRVDPPTVDAHSSTDCYRS